MRMIGLARPYLLPTTLSLLLFGCAAQDANVATLKDGYGALEARRYPEAIAAADKVLAANPQKTLPAEAHYLRGRALEAEALANPNHLAGDLQPARNEYIAAVGMPHASDLDGRARAGVALVAYYQEDYATAFSQWQEAIPKLEKPADKSLALYRLGEAAQRLGKWEQADEFYAQVQQSTPGTDLANKAKAKQGARGFSIQLATFSDLKQANQAVTDMRKGGVVATSIADPANPAHAVLRVGPVGSYAEAKAIKVRFAGTYPSSIILP